MIVLFYLVRVLNVGDTDAKELLPEPQARLVRISSSVNDFFK
jgi:hypothetical protein